MVKKILSARSPIKTLEKNLRGGVGPGHLGVFASRKGVGKTACLVQIALDRLFEDRPVIHVSYASRVDYIISWYEELFKKLASRENLKSEMEVHDRVVRNRVILNFRQEGMKTEQVLKSIEALLGPGNFAARTIIVDGFNFYLPCAQDLAQFKKFAVDRQLEFWFSCSLKGEDPLFDDQGLPFVLKDYLPSLDIIITLEHDNGRVRLNLVKDHDQISSKKLRLELDPQTLLLTRI
ncbi:MAG: hypothetical protein OP8BY_0107 [Candidatus Saccharicenans subterraneus]|uniref:Cytoplasmic protein n=1 Tax=Candidatus Saccharicenans subterraneus TaxID=2508984 RepID=A0A3E2BM63_9BACT|nr:MAG: hypothetical protein OP8BY_0107 [Candidatus Saccharicenans subterraneum]